MESSVVYRLLKSLFLLIHFTNSCTGHNYDVINGTELIFAFLVHRHGDRTPIKYSNLASFVKEPEVLDNLMETYGAGQLTTAGQLRGYQLGQFIRSRYSSLLSPRYNSSDIYIKSTDVPRTQMTLLTALAAVYPPLDDNWSGEINWTPVPYTTENVNQDFMTSFMGSCMRYTRYLMTAKPQLTRNKTAFRKWSQIVGKDLSKNPSQAYAIYTDYESYRSVGFPLIDPLEEIWPEIKEIADEILDLLIGNEETLPLLTGVLVNEFFSTAYSALAAGALGSPRLRVYSGHDLNVYGLIAGMRVQEHSRPGAPQFASAFSLEVRRVVATGQVVVLPVYLPEADKGEVLYLPIEGCGILCNINRLEQLTSSIILSQRKWKKACSLMPRN